MSFWGSLAFIGFGLGALAVSMFGQNFRKSDVLAPGVDYGPSSTWSGKLLFAIVGSCFLALGFYFLFHS